MPRVSPRELLSIAAAWTLITIGYVIAGKLGLALALLNPSASAVWPPTGMAIGAAVLLGPRVWPAIFAGAFIVNQTTAGSVTSSLAIAAGNTGEALIAARLMIRYAGGTNAFDRTHNFFAFVLLAGFLSTTISATSGVTSLAVAGEVSWAHYGSVWLTWWLGNAAGAVIVAPVVILWGTRRQFGWSARRWFELLLLASSVAAVGRIVFIESSLPIEFISIPLCVWAGARFGSRESATVTAILSGLAVWGALRGAGPFANQPPNTGLLLTQSFMVVAQLAGLGIAAALAELKSAHECVQQLNQNLEDRVATRTAELQESEARLAEAQEVAQIGSWEWDVVGNQLWWSDQLYRFWRTSRDRYHPTYDGFLSAVHADDRARVQSTIERSMIDGLPFDLEFRVTPSGAEPRIVLSKGRVIRDAAGQPVRMVGTAQDVSEHRQLEAQFRQAQKLEALGLLAGGIAHDFNNLITAMGGYTELALVDMAETDRKRGDLMEVRKAAERAASLTRRLLSFSRPQSLQTKLVDLNALVAGIQDFLRRTIGEHIEIVLDLDPELDHIRADDAQLEQVLLNLALNARDAMPEGGRLRFATAMAYVSDNDGRRCPATAPGRYARLTVSDTGIGMSPEIQARIFEPFFTTKPPGQGTGFGLATAYGIVKQSGGYIWVHSEPGLGSTFEVYLPAARNRIESLDRGVSQVAANGGTETILLVEDDGAVRRLARTVLRDAGYTVLDARDGEEALTLAASSQRVIDLVITDVVMPGLSGRDLALSLTASYPAIRVLYTSGYTRTATMTTGIERSAPFLPKPFLPVDLLAKVREVFGDSRVVPQPRPR